MPLVRLAARLKADEARVYQIQNSKFEVVPRHAAHHPKVGDDPIPIRTSGSQLAQALFCRHA
jgi:hypothetical protein